MSLVDDVLYFRFLIMNKSFTTIDVQVLVCPFSVLLGVLLGVELNLKTLCLPLYRITGLFSTVAVQFPSTPAMCDDSCFSTFLPTFVIARLISYSYFSQCEMVSHWFQFVFP